MITGVYRNVDILGDPTKPASADNPGGGTITKVYNLERAVPSINITNNLGEVRKFALVEALWFSERGDELRDKRVEAYENLGAFKILWTSDMEVFRMPGHVRDRLFDASDVVGVLSEYAYQLIEPFTPKVEMLYDPVDTDLFRPTEKQREIYGIGQVSVQKNVQSIVDIFRNIPPDLDLKKTYIGSKNVWGGVGVDDLADQLELMLCNVCNVERYVPYAHIHHRVSGIWGYVGDTGYDFSSNAMMEAMAIGAWLFCGRHLMYDERPCLRFKTTEEAIQLITEQLETYPPESGVINEEARQFIIDRNSYDAFRRQLQDLIGRRGFGF